MDNTITAEDFSSLGLNVSDDAAAGQALDDTTPANDQLEATNQQPQTQNTQPDDKPVEDDKSSRAFAKLRTENKALNQLVTDLAKAYNIEGKDSAEVMTALKEHLLEKQAQEQNVPKELLSRLNVLEAQKKEYDTFTRAQKTEKAFEALKTEFNLSQEQIIAFVKQTAADGINPFEQDGIDIRREYIMRNYNTLIKAAEERGARAEAERATKANTNSTNPGNRSSQTPGTPNKINTVSALEDFLNKLN